MHFLAIFSIILATKLAGSVPSTVITPGPVGPNKCLNVGELQPEFQSIVLNKHVKFSHQRRQIAECAEYIDSFVASRWSIIPEELQTRHRLFQNSIEAAIAKADLLNLGDLSDKRLLVEGATGVLEQFEQSLQRGQYESHESWKTNVLKIIGQQVERFCHDFGLAFQEIIDTYEEIPAKPGTRFAVSELLSYKSKLLIMNSSRCKKFGFSQTIPVQEIMSTLLVKNPEFNGETVLTRQHSKLFGNQQPLTSDETLDQLASYANMLTNIDEFVETRRELLALIDTVKDFNKNKCKKRALDQMIRMIGFYCGSRNIFNLLRETFERETSGCWPANTPKLYVPVSSKDQNKVRQELMNAARNQQCSTSSQASQLTDSDSRPPVAFESSLFQGLAEFRQQEATIETLEQRLEANYINTPEKIRKRMASLVGHIDNPTLGTLTTAQTRARLASFIRLNSPLHFWKAQSGDRFSEFKHWLKDLLMSKSIQRFKVSMRPSIDNILQQLSSRQLEPEQVLSKITLDIMRALQILDTMDSFTNQDFLDVYNSIRNNIKN